jgi:hypothetical protein
MRLPRLAALMLAVPILVAPMLAACSSPGPRERLARKESMVERYAGDPVKSFRFLRMDNFEILGPNSILVWTRINQAYLLTVDEPCFGLEFATAVGLSSTMNTVYRRTDDVVFKDQRCAIAEIRPVDVKSLKAERRGEIVPPPEASGG